MFTDSPPFKANSTVQLKSPLALLRQAAEDYQAHLQQIIGILALGAAGVVVGVAALIGVLAVSGVIAVAGGVGLGIVVGTVFGALALAVVIGVQLWVPLAILAAVREAGELSARAAYRATRSLVPGYFWVTVLTALITLAGFMLLVVPGFLVAVWFSLTLFVVSEEPHRGINALLRSRNYVRGRWWPVAGRLLIAMLVSIAASLPGSVLTDGLGFSAFGNAVNFVIQLLLTPFLILYTYALYRDLKATASQTALEEARGRGLLSAAALGAALLLVATAIGLLLTGRFW